MPDGNRDTFTEFRANTAGVRQMIRVVRKPSATVTPEELGGPFDLVFLDGDHSFLQTRADFSLVAPLLSPTGTIALHDINCFEGVSRVVGEALASGAWRIAGYFSNLVWLQHAKFDYPA
jgi:predicted O-methyltransferase YrrM